MLSGRRLNLLDPAPLDIEIEDIAHGLARVARWNGQTLGKHPFSVAQHSLLVEHIFSAMSPAATARDRLAALLHDAPEYVVGDLISPFKAAIGDTYKTFELRLENAIHQRFAIPFEGPARKSLIKRADRAAAHLEANRLAGFSPEEAQTLFGPPPPDADDLCARFLTPWPTEEAQTNLLTRFQQLDGAV
ncbi:MAG: HD family hydrolase [Pseudomonadota bacterium]